jgi:hypothetical protein
LAAVEKLCQSPLNAIGSKLNRALQAITQAHESGAVGRDQVARVSDFAIEIIRSLPQSYGDRFWFDAGLIQAMANDWSEQRVFSSMLAPRYERQWGYTRLPMPLSEAPSVPGESRHHIVELIRLPGNDDLGHVDLLRYPFIGHELAHSLMFRYDEALIPLVRPVVATAIRRLRLAAVPDRGRARAVSQNAIEECVGFWSPTPDHWNWTHELCADLIAAWVLGPAYLAVFVDLLSDANLDPYQISTIHPPYAVRAAGLLRFAQQLGVLSEIEELEKLADSWRSSRWRKQRTNRFHFLADSEIIDGIVDSASQFCETLRLRRWSKDRMPHLGGDLSNQSSLGLGTDLLLVAWLAFSRYGEQEYAEWEASVVRSIADSLKQ